MKLYIVHGGNLYGSILYGIYSSKESAEKRVNSFITSEKELIGAKQRIETNYPYFRDITPEELIRSYYKIDETELDKDLEYDEQVVFYAE